MKVEDICKLVPCSTCLGAGEVQRYPHYSNPMPALKVEKCENCRGVGQVVLVASGVATVRDTSFRLTGL